jgi:hypothetical protein
MGKILEIVIIILLLLILSFLYGVPFLGMLKIIGTWIYQFLVWFVGLVGRVAPK